MRLIDADELLKRRRKVVEYDEAGFSIDYFAVPVEEINNAPTVEARPSGEWEDCGWVELDGHGGISTYPHEGMRCSNCNRAFKKELLWKDNFCPNCGCDMRGGKNENNI